MSRGDPSPHGPAPLAAIVEHTRLVRELEAVFERLCDAGRIGSTCPAGDARIVQVACGLALDGRDMLFGTARDLPAAVARGAALSAVFCQAFSVAGDPSLGRGLPGAFNDAALRVSLSDGAPASHLVHAAGFGHAAQLRGDGVVALGLFGSGAQASGELHAALGFAALYRARAVFVARGELADEVPLTEAAIAWGIRVVEVPGDDGCAVWQAVREARRLAVAGEGPTVIEARLTEAARPLDEAALRDVSPPDASTTQHSRDRIRTALATARQAAEAALPIDPDTLTHAVLSDQPWFLEPRAAGGLA